MLEVTNCTIRRALCQYQGRFTPWGEQTSPARGRPGAARPGGEGDRSNAEGGSVCLRHPEEDLVTVQRCIAHRLRNVRFGPLGILAREGFRLVTAFDALHPFGLPGINVGVYRSARLVSPAQEEIVSTVVGHISDVHNRD